MNNQGRGPCKAFVDVKVECEDGRVMYLHLQCSDWDDHTGFHTVKDEGVTGTWPQR